MGRNAFTIGFFGLVLAIIIGLNLLLVSQPGAEETEADGSRSSYKASPFGTLAFHELLVAKGHRVSRFERPYTELADSSINTLVIVAPDAAVGMSEEEIAALGDWIADGGRAIVIDRFVSFSVDGMTIETGTQISGTPRPVSVSPLTTGVKSLKVTEYATTVEDVEETAVVHVAANDRAMLIDRAYGAGHIVVLTEPYVIQNNGIREADNLALALNLLGSTETAGAIAFDEYHHGFGSMGGGGGGGLRGYIAGTPVPWIILQLALLGLLMALTFGSRFARPVPLRRERRTSALEFVSSMANIQRLAKASDLAIENIYGHFRRRLCRYAGLPSNTMTDSLATVAAERAQIDRNELLSVMRRCENALAIRPPEPSDLVDLISDLRRVEAKLKL